MHICAMYFDQIHFAVPPVHYLSYLPYQFSFPLHSLKKKVNLAEFVSASRVCMGIGPSAGAWIASQWPHP